jgi:hypothetical protein
VVAGVVTPTLHWPVSLPLREPPQAIFPLLSPLLSRHPAISKTPPTFHFHSRSASTFSTHHNLRPRNQPLLLTAKRHHRFTWQRPLYSTPSSSSFHEHITNEQLHDSESARHTLNPTGPRERARGARRSQLSFCEEGPTPTPECRCHCRRRRQSTLQPSGFPRSTCKRDKPSTRCLAQAWQSCHPRQHQHRLPGRPHSPQRENTSASFATGPSAGASTGADMSGLVCLIFLYCRRRRSAPGRCKLTHSRRYQGAPVQVHEVSQHLCAPRYSPPS